MNSGWVHIEWPLRHEYLLASTLIATQQFCAASETLSSSQLDINCADCSSSPENSKVRVQNTLLLIPGGKLFLF